MFSCHAKNFLFYFAIIFLSSGLFAAGLPDLASLREKADTGDVRSQGLLAEYLRKGDSGLKKDYALSFKYAKMAAEKNDPFGLYTLAIIYDEGLGAAKDAKLAGKYFKLAFEPMLALARDSDPNAQYDAGYMLLTGNGVIRDRMEGFYWVRKAAGQGHAFAQYTLGYMYLNGSWGADKDYEKALNWFNFAAQNNEPAAFFSIAMIYLNGYGVKKDSAIAFENFKKTAEYNDSNALFMLGLMSENGNGTPKDMAAAKKYYERAAALNNLKAKDRLSVW